MSARVDQIAALYAEQARLVQRQVARRVNAPTAVIEDACQTAWERLCTHPDVDPAMPAPFDGRWSPRCARRGDAPAAARS
jgi:hypothetical protein